MNDLFMWGMITQCFIAGTLSVCGLIQLSSGQQFLTGVILMIVAAIFSKRN